MDSSGLRIGKQGEASRVSGLASAGIDHRLRQQRVSRGSDRSDDGVSGRSPDGDALPRVLTEARARNEDEVSIDAAPFLLLTSAWRRTGRGRGSRSTRNRAGLAEAGATRSGAHPHDVGGCAQHTRPREPLLDLALPRAQDMDACYAKRRAGAALACEHAFRPLQRRKRRDSPAVCVTQRYVKSAARPTYPRTKMPALRSRALTDSFLLHDHRGPGQGRRRTPYCPGRARRAHPQASSQAVAVAHAAGSRQ